MSGEITRLEVLLWRRAWDLFYNDLERSLKPKPEHCNSGFRVKGDVQDPIFRGKECLVILAGNLKTGMLARMDRTCVYCPVITPLAKMPALLSVEPGGATEKRGSPSVCEHSRHSSIRTPSK